MADIVLIIIIVLFAFIGAKKGLVKTVFGAASTLVSLILSIMLYNPVSQMLYASSFGESVRSFIEEMLSEKMQDGVKILLLEQATDTASLLVVNVISFLFVVLSVKLIVAILGNVFNIVSKMPVIKQANSLLGLAAGAISGLLVCYIIIGVIAALGADGNISFMQESVENSMFVYGLYKDNLIADVLSDFLK